LLRDDSSGKSGDHYRLSRGGAMEAWMRMAQALGASDRPEDRGLAVEIARFVQSTPFLREADRSRRPTDACRRMYRRGATRGTAAPRSVAEPTPLAPPRGRGSPGRRTGSGAAAWTRRQPRSRQRVGLAVSRQGSAAPGDARPGPDTAMQVRGVGRSDPFAVFVGRARGSWQV